MSIEQITVRGARQHNLKNIDVDIPRDKFTVITGLFLPLTFLTGLLGINVGGIPGSESPIGFFVACGLMILLAVGQVLLFRRWRWL